MIRDVQLQYASLEAALSEQPEGTVSRVSLSFADEATAFFVVKGQRSGPTLWVQAALHGDEYDGIVAILRLLETIMPSSLQGQIILCPVVNPSACLAGTNGSPVDSVNLNRVFGQERKDSYSYHYGEWLLQQIVQHADFLIDLHGGGAYLDVCPFAMLPTNHLQAYQTAGRLLNQLQLTAIYECPSDAKGMLVQAVCEAGIPAVLLESGGGNAWKPEAVRQHEHSIAMILSGLGMQSEVVPFTPLQSPITIREVKELRFETSGLLLRHAAVGSIVTLGEELLKVVSLPGFEESVLSCPVPQAIILSIHTASTVKTQGYAVMLGVLESSVEDTQG
ncbi:succinylglutamate desuccinylase/aspartoacylase family protein [Paenibacillus massiliensis]|uniref:succinylglutamate desuccinylase/aspartoacylase domain-containing protein n=1 Tax=Paenibacillus massiliensis TaxID=225917 RepID=UPI00047138B8|nr:succinylglutamate desuccinylase/aspartoacylase family protein [Paenibacillus massiliensis]